jgi:hypothetical protein
MHSGKGEAGATPPAPSATMSEPTTTDNSDSSNSLEAASSGGIGGTRGRAIAQRYLTGRSRRLLVTAAVLLVLLAVLPALLDASHSHGGTARAQPGPTATATATATPIPGLTPIAGYTPYVDRTDGFIIQYPNVWSCAPSHPGVECIDSPDAQNYKLQVQLPGNWTQANTGSDPNDASVWVDYALSAFSDTPGYQRVPNPPEPGAYGGATWRAGAAVISVQQSSDPNATPSGPPVRIRVQVYATVHDERPYIIALYAADDQFGDGVNRYFQPMLNSFQFLPAGG